jgi:CobQ-like glutamine amidotransferase family enzyme
MVGAIFVFSLSFRLIVKRKTPFWDEKFYLPTKKENLADYIENGGVMLAICGGFQLLGKYYIEAGGRKIDGLGILGHYTLNQTNNRYIGDIKIHNDEFNETYYGFENHQGRTFLADNQKPLGNVVYGNGNNKEDGGEGMHYKNTFGSYFHGPILSRNANLAYRLVTTALRKKYGQDIPLASYADILSKEVAEEYGDVKSKAEFEK